ncbi:MAG: hypothetical protein WDW36_009194 [Sanguina aurantia]
MLCMRGDDRVVCASLLESRVPFSNNSPHNLPRSIPHASVYLCADKNAADHTNYACSVGAEAQKIDNGVAFDAEATAVGVRDSKVVLTPDGPDMQYSTGFCCSQGNCPHMEDRVVHVDISREAAVQPCSRAFFTAVLDGHAGVETVDHLAETLLPALLAHGGVNNRLRTDTLAVLRAAILGCEADVLSRGFTSGSTVLAAIMIDDQLFVANVGDCRAVVCEKRGPPDLLPTSLSLPGPHAAGSTIEAIALAAAAAAALRTYSECGSSCSGFGSGSQTPVRAGSFGGDFSPNGSSAWVQQFQQREDAAAAATSLSASTASPTPSPLGSPPSSSSPCAAAPAPTAFSRPPVAAAHPSAAAALSAFASLRQTLQAATSLSPRRPPPDAGAAVGPATPSPRSRGGGGAPQRPCRAGVSALVVEGLQVRQLTNDHAIKGNMLEKARVQAMGVSVSGDGYVHLTVNGECNDSGVTRVLGRAHIKRAASNPSLALLCRRSQAQSLAGSAMEWDAQTEDLRTTPTGQQQQPQQQQHPELRTSPRCSPQPRSLDQPQAQCEQGLASMPAARTHNGHSVRPQDAAPPTHLVQASQLLLAAGLVHTSRLMELCGRIPSLPGSGSSLHAPRREHPTTEGSGACTGAPSADDSGRQTSTAAEEQRAPLHCDAQEQEQQQQQQGVQHGREQAALRHAQQQQRRQLSDSQRETLVDSLGGGCCVLIPDPELHTYAITRDSEFLVLACDGIWDVMTNGEVVRTVRRVLAGGGTAPEAAAALAKRAVAAPESRDNCSVVVVCFSSRQLHSHSTRNSALRRGPSLVVPSAKLEMRSVAE